MDWIGDIDKLSVLIAKGKRALGRKIVVVPDSKEDDGSGAWEGSVPASSSPRTNARRRRSPLPLPLHRIGATDNLIPGSSSNPSQPPSLFFPKPRPLPCWTHHLGQAVDEQ